MVAASSEPRPARPWRVRFSDSIPVERLVVRERRKRLWNGRSPRAEGGAAEGGAAQSAADVDALDTVPDVEALLATDERYVASMQRVLAVSAAFQKMLEGRRLEVWLELEEAILTHLAYVQGRCYLAGRAEGREQMLAEARHLLLEALGHLHECGRRSS